MQKEKLQSTDSLFWNIGGFIRRHPHPQYNNYLDERLFNTFQLEDGNIVWGEDWDLIFPVEQHHKDVVC